MNKKYVYRWTVNEEFSVPNNNYSCETEYIICEPPYDFEDFLSDSNVNFEKDGNMYYVLGEDGERTGEAFWVISVMDTDEDI